MVLPRLNGEERVVGKCGVRLYFKGWVAWKYGDYVRVFGEIACALLLVCFFCGDSEFLILGDVLSDIVKLRFYFLFFILKIN